MKELLSLTILELHKKLADRKLSSQELTKAYLTAIRKRDKDLHAYLEVTEAQALEDAKRADELLALGESQSLLLGIPLAVKDNILVEGTIRTAASLMLENYTASYDATVIQKLKEAGAVFLGRTNMDEFAMGASTENSAFTPTCNPHDHSRVPGGSSGGSAAAVAANLCVASLGSDTGGSVRQPAAFCGVVGMKPSYGAVSRHGLIAMASSLDQIGPLARSVEDARVLFDVIHGQDSLDSTSLDIAPPTEGLRPRMLKIGVPKEYFVKGIDTALEAKVRDAIGQYEKMGGRIIEISLPHTEYALPAYYIIMPAEVSANLARYDGMRYGFSADSGNAGSIADSYFQSRGKGFGTEVRRRIMLGTYILSAGYYEAYYVRAQKVRTLVAQDFKKAFREVDVIMAPTTPTPAFKIGEKSQDPVAMYLSDIFTVSVNLAGLPAVSVPCGTVSEAGSSLPVGLQITGNFKHDYDVLEVA